MYDGLTETLKYSSSLTFLNCLQNIIHKKFARNKMGEEGGNANWFWTAYQINGALIGRSAQVLRSRADFDWFSAYQLFLYIPYLLLLSFSLLFFLWIPLQEALNQLRKNLANKWNFITVQAEEQVLFFTLSQDRISYSHNNSWDFMQSRETWTSTIFFPLG